ncbi:unnamed protein product [Cladocopium goreaui]|uniref:Uncharacterized protein n=1 Tax=Cladocopium goreaui TaxID=2562237 RepID=A0A9P1BSF5_9DINO|nr:unnamed protein product [Cladocopium goreaui]
MAPNALTAVRRIRWPARQHGCHVRYFTNWWQKWVDGKNPDNPKNALVSRLLRQEFIDPYKIPRDELEDFRRQYLFRYEYPEWEAGDNKSTADMESEEYKQDAWERLRRKKGHIMERWKGLYALQAPRKIETQTEEKDAE